MDDHEISQGSGRVSSTLNNGTSAELPEQDSSRLVETTPELIDAQEDDLAPKRLHVVEKNGRDFKVADSNLDFWRSVESGLWEPRTFDVFDHFITPETVFLDIGAWIGPTSLYGAQLAKMTYSFEPDPVAYKVLQANLQANSDAPWRGRIEALNVAVAEFAGALEMGSRSSGGDSMSSTLFAGERTTWTVNSVALAEFVAERRLVDEKLFLKIDIEGGEYALLPSLTSLLRMADSDLLLSVHPQFLLTSLRQKNGRTIFGKIKTRLEFARHHRRLARALPYEHSLSPDGHRCDLRREVLRALLVGRFPSEILASNRKLHQLEAP